MAQVRVYVTLKEGILDPQGQTVLRALKSLGYEEVLDLRIGKYMEIEVQGKNRKNIEKKVDEMCEKLLANPIIENYRIEVDAR